MICSIEPLSPMWFAFALSSAIVCIEAWLIAFKTKDRHLHFAWLILSIGAMSMVCLRVIELTPMWVRWAEPDHVPSELWFFRLPVIGVLTCILFPLYKKPKHKKK